MPDPYEQLFNADLDRDTDADLLKEFFWSTVSRHTVLIVNQAAAKNIYGEPTGEPSYTESDPFPIHIKLDPEQEMLDKFGYDRKREAVAFFCTLILKDLDIEPKVGDRINFAYQDPSGDAIVEQFIINEISPEAFVRQKGYAYQQVAAIDRTEKKKVAL